MFKQLPDDNAELVTVIIEERPVKVPRNYSAAAAVLSELDRTQPDDARFGARRADPIA